MPKKVVKPFRFDLRAAQKYLSSLSPNADTEFIDVLNALSLKCRVASDTWWHTPSGRLKKRNKGELLMLMVSELAEAMEGERKDLMDDKLPHRRMAEVELADAIIRLMDYAGAYGFDIGGAVIEKMAFNAKRPDHKLKNRLKKNGKKF